MLNTFFHMTCRLLPKNQPFQRARKTTTPTIVTSMRIIETNITTTTTPRNTKNDKKMELRWEVTADFGNGGKIPCWERAIDQAVLDQVPTMLIQLLNSQWTRLPFKNWTNFLSYCPTPLCPTKIFL